MPKMTAKYAGAVYLLDYRNLPAVNRDNQEEVYQMLQEQGFFWNSTLKTWEEHDIDDADEPTQLILVRVWGDADIVEEAADDIVTSNAKRWDLVERSTPYPCRPPKQREARVYLKFLSRRKS